MGIWYIIAEKQAHCKTKDKTMQSESFFHVWIWAAVNVGADKHEAELEERDKQGSRPTLLYSLQVKCATLVVQGIFREILRHFWATWILAKSHHIFAMKYMNLNWRDEGSRPTLAHSLQLIRTTLYWHQVMESWVVLRWEFWHFWAKDILAKSHPILMCTTTYFSPSDEG